MTEQNGTKVEVRIAGLNETTPQMKGFWDVLQATLSAGCTRLGADAALSVALSAVGRELRRHVGAEDAATVLRALADQQTETVRYDLPHRAGHG
jgi:hypothetical protein